MVAAKPTCDRAANANTARSGHGRTTLKVLPVRFTNMQSGFGRDVLAFFFLVVLHLLFLANKTRATQRIHQNNSEK